MWSITSKPTGPQSTPDPEGRIWSPFERGADISMCLTHIKVPSCISTAVTYDGVTYKK